MNARGPRTIVGDWLRVHSAAMAAAWFGAVLVFQAIDAFENLREYTRGGATGGEIAMYFALRTPEVGQQILPAAVLLGGLLAMFRLAKARELTAAEAVGMHPLWAFAVPLGLAAASAAVQVGLESSVLPHSRAVVDEFHARHIEKNPLRDPGDVRWALHDDSLWRVHKRGDEPATFAAEIYRRDGATLTVTIVDELVAVAGGWRTGAARRVSGPPLTVVAAVTAPAVPFLPEELEPVRPATRHQTLVQLWDQRRRKRDLTGESGGAAMELHQRLSWSLLAVTVLLAALPFVPRHGRRASTAVGALLALAIGVAAWAVVVAGAAVAAAYRWPGGFWLPHVTLVLTGLAASTRIVVGSSGRRRRS